MRFASALIVCLFASLPAIAQSAPAKFFYKGLYQTELNGTSSSNYLGGSIAINGKNRSIELTLQGKMPECAEGMMCIQVMPEPVTYVLEGSKSYYDGCGALVTEASYDQRPVDGIYLKVTVRDYANNKGGVADACFSKVAVAPTEVTVEQDYDSYLVKDSRTIDGFRGEALTEVAEPVLTPVPYAGPINKISYSKSKKSLVVNLSYSGGCREHEFALEWGTCKEAKVGRRLVKECAVTLVRTKGQDDYCEAFITRDHSIDLSQLGAPYIINLEGRRILVGK